MNRSLKFLPRLQDIFFISLFFAILLLGSRMINLDGDLPRHLTFGRLILSERQIPPTEPLIYPYENRTYTSHEWLSQTLYAWIYSVGGLPALVLAAALLLSTTFYLLYAYLVERFSLRLPTLFIVAWGAVATSLNWAIRPHLFSMLLFVLCLIWADRLQRGDQISIWRFPVLMILWSNLHGIFIAGILILISFAVGWAVDHFTKNIFTLQKKQEDENEQTFASLHGPSWLTGKRLWLTLILSIGGSLLNPGLADSWFRILGFVNNPYLMSRMVEANPPNFQLPEMRIILALIAFSVFLLAVKRNALSSGQGFLLAGFTAMSLMSFRNIQLYGIAAPFVLTEAFASLRDFPILNRLENTLSNIENKVSGAFYPVAAAFLLGLFVLLSPLSKDLYQFEPGTFPVQAVQWLKANPQAGNMFNDLNWGGYLELNLYPQKTFADSVADVTGEVTMDYETILTLGTGWDNLMQVYHIEWVILRPNEPLVRTLTERGWQILYQDSTTAILR